MLPAHKAVFDRIGKALVRDIKKVEIDLDPPRCQRQGWGIPNDSSHAATKSWWDKAQTFQKSFEGHFGDESGKHYYLSPEAMQISGLGMSNWSKQMADFVPPIIISSILTPSPDEVEKYGKQGEAPKPQHPETKAEKRRKKKGKG